MFSSSQSASFTLVLVHTADGQKPRVYRLRQSLVKLGTGRRSDIVLGSEKASDLQAVIEVDGEGNVEFCDVAANGPVHVNGRLTGRSKLRAGDSVRWQGEAICLQEVTKHQASKQEGPSLGVPFWKSAHNPFAAKAPAAAPAKAPRADLSHMDDAQAEALEVMVRWGKDVLQLDHLKPPRGFYVGSKSSKQESLDCELPLEQLGSERAPLCTVLEGVSYGVALPDAEVSLQLASGERMGLEAVKAAGMGMAAPQQPGAWLVPLAQGSRLRTKVGEFSFEVAAVRPARKPVGAFLAASALALAGFVGASAAAHVGTLAAMAYAQPSMTTPDEGNGLRERQLMMQRLLKASAEREDAAAKEEVSEEATADDAPAGSGKRAKGSAGTMGKSTAKAKGKRMGVRGPADNTDPHISRAIARSDAANFGIIGLLNAGVGGDPDAPTAPWARDDSLGNDPLSARGNMWGAEIGDAQGTNGLALSGVGEGGDGTHESIGLTNIGTWGNRPTPGSGRFVSALPRLKGKHRVRTPKVRIGQSQQSGNLPAAIVQRIVRQNFGRFRLCYQQGLKNNPSLQGRVSVRFVISRSGVVANTANGGSDLPDPSVVSCVVRSFAGLSFPSPDGGIVRVVYPISFAPGS